MRRIKKIIAYTIGIVFCILLLGSIAGIRYFNQMWFKDRPNHLVLSSDMAPIAFSWTKSTYGDYVEHKDAIIIQLRLAGVAHQVYLQFDTGDPTTKLFGNSVASLQQMGVAIPEVSIDGQTFLENISLNLGGSQIEAKMMAISDGIGPSFGIADTLEAIRIGTIGADFLSHYLTEIDFKQQIIQFYPERQDWMTATHEFLPFDFSGRRFMLPCEINQQEFELFYDSGSSAFGLITIKQRYHKYSTSDSKEITYEANGHGNAIPVRHKATDAIMQIGGLDLPLQRVSYVDMYSNVQGLITPFTKIGGWLGNKPFTECSLIVDPQQEEFIILRR